MVTNLPIQVGIPVTDLLMSCNFKLTFHCSLDQIKLVANSLKVANENKNLAFKPYQKNPQVHKQILGDVAQFRYFINGQWHVLHQLVSILITRSFQALGTRLGINFEIEKKAIALDRR
jgi:hypothetical protein